MYPPKGTYAPYPKTVDGKINKVVLKEQYMESSNMQWKAFCNEHHYNPKVSNAPVKAWQKEKAKFVMDNHRLTLREKILKHENKWHLQVLDTLDKYPDLCDTAEKIIRSYLVTINNEIARQLKAVASGEVIEEKDKFYKKFKPFDIVALANAIKTITEAKHRSLMLDTWSIKATNERANDEALAKKTEQTKEHEFAIELISKDGENYSMKELGNLLQNCYDAPWTEQKAADEKPPA